MVRSKPQNSSSELIGTQLKEVTLKDGRVLLLRQIKKSDVYGIWRNFNKVVAERIYLPVYTPVVDDWEKEHWFSEITSHGNFCVVAIDPEKTWENKIVGQCTIERLEWEAATHVGQLGIIVREGYRGLGLGYELISWAKEIAQTNGKTKLVLSTFNTNQMGMALYQRAGFYEIGRYSNQFFIADTYVDEVLMECWLDSEINDVMKQKNQKKLER